MTVFVFDFDGVIVDSIDSLYNAYLEFLQEFSIRGNREEFNLLNGPSLPEIISYLKEKYKLKKNEKELLNVYLGKISKAYENIKLNDGVEEILKFLKRKKIKIALASSSKKGKILSILERYNLKNYFDFIVSGDEVQRSKPSSDIYNLVKNEFPDSDFYVVEDSYNGIIAAKEAGMNTILYSPDLNIKEIEPPYVISSFKQIKNIVQEIELNCFTIAKSETIFLKLVDYSLQIDQELESFIDDFWGKEQKKKKLVNGKIVSYISHKKEKDKVIIYGFITEYKYFYARIKNPEINLNVYPIGVSGIIIDEDNNTLIAMRQNVTEYKGFYELVPAGSVDPSKKDENIILFKEQLCAEFEEETGVSSKIIKDVEPFCFIYDRTDGVYDICSKINIEGLLSEKIKNSETEEYKNIEIVSIDKLLAGSGKLKLVPTSIVLLNNF
jgi:HAD superfamily hydrolase (TIGR01509 family)